MIITLLTTLFALTLLGGTADTLNYISNERDFLVYINATMLVVLGIAFPLFLLKKINTQWAAVALVFTTTASIITTNLYLKQNGFEIWELSFLRDIPVFFVFALTLSLINSKIYFVLFNLTNSKLGFAAKQENILKKIQIKPQPQTKSKIFFFGIFHDPTILDIIPGN